VKKNDDLVGVVVGKYLTGFLVIDHEGDFIGDYFSLTTVLFAVARGDEIRTLEAIGSQPVFLGQTYDGQGERAMKRMLVTGAGIAALDG